MYSYFFPFFSGTPIALSNPHFFNGDPCLQVEGLKPNADKHRNYFSIEPVSSKQDLLRLSAIQNATFWCGTLVFLISRVSAQVLVLALASFSTTGMLHLMKESKKKQSFRLATYTCYLHVIAFPKSGLYLISHKPV